MKISDMVDLVNEMIEILDHNQSILNESKKLGYNGYIPSYEMYKRELEEAKNELIEFSMQEESDALQEKLEEVCECLCLLYLAHGSNNDEFYLCKLSNISADNALSNKEDCTVTLATKYGLQVTNRTYVYLEKLKVLFSELQSENQFQNGMSL